MNLKYSTSLWMQDKVLQKAWHKYNIEYQIYLAQRAYQNWIAMGDRDTEFFKIAATVGNIQNYIRKILVENRIWSDD